MAIVLPRLSSHRHQYRRTACHWKPKFVTVLPVSVRDLPLWFRILPPCIVPNFVATLSHALSYSPRIFRLTVALPSSDCAMTSVVAMGPPVVSLHRLEDDFLLPFVHNHSPIVYQIDLVFKRWDPEYQCQLASSHHKLLSIVTPPTSE